MSRKLVGRTASWLSPLALLMLSAMVGLAASATSTSWVLELRSVLSQEVQVIEDHAMFGVGDNMIDWSICSDLCLANQTTDVMTNALRIKNNSTCECLYIDAKFPKEYIQPGDDMEDVYVVQSK